jgi:phenylalanine-4-hydroxylase
MARLPGDMAVGDEVSSVFGGPADRSRYPEVEDFVAKRVPAKALSDQQRSRNLFFQNLRELREKMRKSTSDPKAMVAARVQFDALLNEYLNQSCGDWLQGVELLELSYQLNLSDNERVHLKSSLDPAQFKTATVRECVKDGVELASQIL